MKKRSLFLKLFCLMGLVLFLLPSFVSASGALIPQVYHDIDTVSHKGVVYFDEESGTETMYMQPVFRGNTEKLVWSFATPSEPKVKWFKGYSAVDEILGDFFENGLSEDEEIEKYLRNDVFYDKLEVVEVNTNKLEKYEMMAASMGVVGFSFNNDYQYIYNKYKEKGWYVTNIILELDELFLENEYSDDVLLATPLFEVVFDTGEIFYPFHLAAVTSPDNVRPEKISGWGDYVEESSYFGKYYEASEKDVDGFSDAILKDEYKGSAENLVFRHLDEVPVVLAVITSTKCKLDGFKSFYYGGVLGSQINSNLDVLEEKEHDLSFFYKKVDRDEIWEDLFIEKLSQEDSDLLDEEVLGSGDDHPLVYLIGYFFIFIFGSILYPGGALFLVGSIMRMGEFQVTKKKGKVFQLIGIVLLIAVGVIGVIYINGMISSEENSSNYIMLRENFYGSIAGVAAGIVIFTTVIVVMVLQRENKKRFKNNKNEKG